MTRVFAGRGGLEVEVDDGVGRLVQRVLRATIPRVVDVIEQRVEQVHREAERAWPVKTGRSLASLEVGIRLPTSTAVEGFVRNAAPYAYYIRGKAQNGKQTYIALIRTPMRAAARDIAAEIGPELRRLFEGS